MWDVFISHAWEDKEDIARPLAEALRRAGLRVWYDEFTLTLGDSLRRSIDRGLAQSKYGVVILSPHFFAKEWPQRELDGLAAREISSGKVILPVWHDVTWEEVRRFSPTLADKLAVSTAKGLDVVVEEILRVLRVPSPPVRPFPTKPRRSVNWKVVGAIAGVIVMLIATLGAWLVLGEGADFLSARLFETPTVTPTTSPTHTPIISTATPTVGTTVSLLGTFTPTISIPYCEEAREQGLISGNTYLCMSSEEGEWMGAGKMWILTPEEGDFLTQVRGIRKEVVIKVDTDREDWSLYFTPPEGQAWTHGVYENARASVLRESQRSSTPMIYVSGGRGCDSVKITGRFEVLELVYDDVGWPIKLKRFAANFEQHCGEDEPALLGYIRFSSTVGP